MEANEVEAARQRGRAQDPAYWRQKYFDLVALNADRDRRRASWQGMALVCSVAAVGLMLLKWLFRW